MAGRTPDGVVGLRRFGSNSRLQWTLEDGSGKRNPPSGRGPPVAALGRCVGFPLALTAAGRSSGAIDSDAWASGAFVGRVGLFRLEGAGYGTEDENIQAKIVAEPASVDGRKEVYINRG